MEQAHILLVEDEPFLAQVVANSLDQQGYQVTHTGDGQQAFDLFSSHRFSLCIVDVMLPGIDGFSLVYQIRQVDKAIPILFLTARTATKDLMEGYGGMIPEKTFSREELFLRIQELLKRIFPPTSGLVGIFFIGRLSHRET